MQVEKQISKEPPGLLGSHESRKKKGVILAELGTDLLLIHRQGKSCIFLARANLFFKGFERFKKCSILLTLI